MYLDLDYFIRKFVLKREYLVNSVRIETPKLHTCKSFLNEKKRIYNSDGGLAKSGMVHDFI